MLDRPPQPAPENPVAAGRTPHEYAARVPGAD